jgi:DNA-binding YbaB/EbfC family protein
VDPGGQIDMQQLLAAAQQMQDQLMNAQQELADAVVEGSAGGGLVTAKVNGQGDLVDLTISPRAIETTDPDETAQTIADLVLAAVRDANRAAADLQAEKMGPLASGIGALGTPGGPGSPGPGTPGSPGPGTPGSPGSIPPIPGVGDFPSQPLGGEPRGDSDLRGDTDLRGDSDMRG